MFRMESSRSSCSLELEESKCLEKDIRRGWGRAKSVFVYMFMVTHTHTHNSRPLHHPHGCILPGFLHRWPVPLLLLHPPLPPVKKRHDSLTNRGLAITHPAPRRQIFAARFVAAIWKNIADRKSSLP